MWWIRARMFAREVGVWDGWVEGLDWMGVAR